MENKEFQQTMEEITAALRQAGYDPYAQLVGYLQTGEDTYITRNGDARIKVQRLDKEQLRQYIESNKRAQS